MATNPIEKLQHLAPTLADFGPIEPLSEVKDAVTPYVGPEVAEDFINNLKEAR
jgi:hypothetical protein